MTERLRGGYDAASFAADPAVFAEELARLDRCAIDRVPKEADLAGLGLKPGMKAVEFGPGSGLFAMAFARMIGAGALTLVDREPRFLEVAGKRCREASPTCTVATVLGDIHELDPDQPYDWAYAGVILQHCPDLDAVGNKLRSWLKPRGVVVLDDFNWGDSTVWPTTSAWERTREAQLAAMTRLGSHPRICNMLAPMLARAGFVDITVEAKGYGGRIGDTFPTAAGTLAFLDPDEKPAGQAALDELLALAKKEPVWSYGVGYRVTGTMPA